MAMLSVAASAMTLGGLAYTSFSLWKQEHCTKDNRLEVTSATEVGLRPYQEDRIIQGSFGTNHQFQVFSIADGHGSAACSQFLQDKLITCFAAMLQRLQRTEGEIEISSLIRETTRQLHSLWEKDYNEVRAGSTLTGVLLDRLDPDILWLFNLGDSDTIVYDTSTYAIVAQTDSHDLSAKRIDQVLYQNPSATIKKDEHGVMRIITPESGLNLSGSFGNTYDPVLSKSMLREVEIVKLRLQKGHRYHIIVASDGVTDDVSPQELGTLLSSNPAMRQAKNIVGYVRTNGQKGDNCTAISLRFST